MTALFTKQLKTIQQILQSPANGLNCYEALIQTNTSISCDFPMNLILTMACQTKSVH